VHHDRLPGPQLPAPEQGQMRRLERQQERGRLGVVEAGRSAGRFHDAAGIHAQRVRGRRGNRDELPTAPVDVVEVQDAALTFTRTSPGPGSGPGRR